MNALLTTVLAVQMLTALIMIGLILMQHGKGADMGAAFGSGGSGSLFGASGSANFMSRATGVLAAIFFCSTLALAYFGNPSPRASTSVLDNAALIKPAVPAAPATGSAQIPGTSIPAAGTSANPVPPAVPASGAGQIPTK
jgi:preprotein translocase subunit SecG